MLFYNNFYESLVTLYTYIFIYNFSLLLIFWTLSQFTSFNFKTVYSFSDLKFNSFYTTTISICFFSMAGVPPFIGFFAKLLLLLSLLNSNFFLFYMFFFILLFFGLYFYLQNLRFLYSTGQRFQNKISYSYCINMRLPVFFVYYTTFTLFFIIFGLVFIDDLILWFSWLFV